MSSFSQFHEEWFNQLNQLVNQLRSAAKPPRTLDEHQNQLVDLVNMTLSHYEKYYQTKFAATVNDALSIIAAPWATYLERSLQWIAGWRPTTAFHLLYSESSILFESNIVDILRGLRTGDLGDLSPAQFRRISDLQCQTVNEENAITEELSQWYDSASDFIEDGEGSRSFEEKIGQLANVMKKADDLRLGTLRRVVELLKPHQAVEFLIAAAELQFGIREWGLNQDRTRRR